METNNEENIFITWFFWQFVETPKFLLQVWGNYFMFAADYFSLPLLLKTFFAPWRRYRWNYPKSFDLTEFFNTLISNVFSRILGALMRIILIVAGICLQIFIAFAGLFIFVFWLLIPFIIIAGIIFVLYV